MDSVSKPQPATWRIVLAAIFDFLSIFFVGGYVIGALLGGLTENGFQLSGGPAVLLIVVIVAYFILFNKFLGGTVWKHILRARR